MAHERHVRALERLSGLSASQAKHLLLKELETRSATTPPGSCARSRRRPSATPTAASATSSPCVMQRLAAGHAAETTVSVSNCRPTT